MSAKIWDEQRAANYLRLVVSSGQLTRGPFIEKVKDGLRRFTDRRFVVLCNSATSALEVVYAALAKRRDKQLTVGVPVNTFWSTATAALRAGAKVEWWAIDADLHARSPSVSSLLSGEIDALVYVSIGGYVAPSVLFTLDTARQQGIDVISDCAQSFGTPGACKIGLASVLSFFATKVFGVGEGGAIVTDDEDFYRSCLSLSDNGRRLGEPPTVCFDPAGAGYRMNEITAALVLSQLDCWREILAHQAELLHYYAKCLDDTGGRVKALWPLTGYNAYKIPVVAGSGMTGDDLTRRMEAAGRKPDTPVYRTPICDQVGLSKVVPATGPLFTEEDRLLARWACGAHVCLPSMMGHTVKDASQAVQALQACLD